jgi:hypothetical protein
MQDEEEEKEEESNDDDDQGSSDIVPRDFFHGLYKIMLVWSLARSANALAVPK